MRPALADTPISSSGTRWAAQTAPFLPLPGAVDLEMPDLFRVGEGEALAPVVVAVGLGQLVGDADGLAGRLGPLEDEPVELGRVDDAVLAHELAAAADRRLADGQLVLVHDRIGGVEEGVGLRDLGDLARLQAVGVLRPFGPLGLVIDLGHLPGLVLRVGDDGHPGPVRPRIAGMRGHRRAVDRGQPADEDAGAGVEVERRILPDGRRLRRGQERQGQDGQPQDREGQGSRSIHGGSPHGRL